jgi:hypothetical protein
VVLARATETDSGEHYCKNCCTIWTPDAAIQNVPPTRVTALDYDDMLWWFEREGRHTRLEILHLATGEFELRVIDADGVEQVEHFTNAVDLAKRQEAIQQMLVAHGWMGPHGWTL